MADTIVDVPTEDNDKDLARRQWVANWRRSDTLMNQENMIAHNHNIEECISESANGSLDSASDNSDNIEKPSSICDTFLTEIYCT